MPKRSPADFDIGRMNQYANVMFASDLQTAEENYPKLDGQHDLQLVRELMGTYTAVCRIPGGDRWVDIHRDGMICSCTEHTELLKPIVAGGRGLLAGTTAAARAQAPPTALEIRRKQKWDSACESLLGRRLTKERPARSSSSAAPELVVAEELSTTVIIEDVTISDLQEMPLVEPPDGYKLVCQRKGCSSAHGGVSFETFTFWMGSRRKFICRNNSRCCT